MKYRYSFFIAIFIVHLTFAQGTWTSKGNIGGVARNAPVGFSIGNYGYICSGGGAAYYKDLWRYDPVSNSWSQLASLPGAARDGAVGFAIGNYGYIGTGSSGSAFLNDFWQYNSGTNSWMQKANFPGTPRYGAVGLAIGNFGFIGIGWVPYTYYNDFWRYDPVTDAWTKMSNYPGLGRVECYALGLGSKGYIGMGANPCNNPYTDFWEYDSSTDTWTAKATFPGIPKQYPVRFALCNMIYAGLGDKCGPPLFNDFYQYNPSTDIWKIRTTFPGVGRDNPFSFSIGNRGYMGTGTNGSGGSLADCWEFYDSTNICGSLPTSLFTPTDTTFCGETGGCIDFQDYSVNNPTSWKWYFPGATPDTSTLQNPLNICYYIPGTYAVTLVVTNSNGKDSLTVSPMVKFSNSPIPPTVTRKTDTLFCSHACGYQWYYSGLPIFGATDSFFVSKQYGTYAVLIKDCSGCYVISDGIIAAVDDLSGLNGAKIYPNLITFSFTIQFNTQLKDAEVIIYNILGSEMMSKRFSGNKLELEKGNLKSGVYFVRVKSSDRQWVQKIIIE